MLNSLLNSPLSLYLNSLVNHSRAFLVGAILFLLAVSYTIFQRFYGITSLGITDSDAFWYWEMAREWYHGNYFDIRHYRPFSHILNALGMAAFGVNDYALKMVTAIHDTLNIFLTLVLGLLIFKNRLMAFLPALIYAFHPLAIELSQHEQVHLSTMTYLLFAVIFFQKYLLDTYANEKVSRCWLALSGFSLALSGHTHPEIFVHAAFFVLFIAIKNKELVRPLLKDIPYWVGGYVAVFAAFFIILGPIEVVTNLYKGASFQHGALAPRTFYESVERFIIGQHIYYSKIGSWFAAIVFYVAVATLIFWKLKSNKKYPLIIYLLVALVIAQVSLCLILVSRNFLTRLALPFFPLLAILIFYTIERVYGWKSWQGIKLFKGLVLALLIIFTMGYSTKYKRADSYFKRFTDVINKHSGGDHQVLLLPVLYYNIHDGFYFRLHLGEKSTYVFHVGQRNKLNDPKEDMIKYITEGGYNYFIWGKRHIDRRVMSDPVHHQRGAPVIKNLYQTTAHEFSEDWERALWDQIFDRINAVVIYEDNDAIIYHTKREDHL